VSTTLPRGKRRLGLVVPKGKCNQREHPLAGGAR